MRQTTIPNFAVQQIAPKTIFNREKQCPRRYWLKKSGTIFLVMAVQLLTNYGILSAQVNDLEELQTQVVSDPLKQLKEQQIFGNDNLLNAKINEIFKGKEKAAVESALNILHTPRIQIIDGKESDRYMDLVIAKKVFHRFPGESLELLKKEYQTGNAILRGNIIQAIGTMDAEDDVRPLLIMALSDTAFIETMDINTSSETAPLRVCDAAYNQLVLRYAIKDVLRTISGMHNIETRDYHINILKNKL